MRIKQIIENMKNSLVLLLLFASFSSYSQFPNYIYKLSETDGMPISNFAIAANISNSGTLFNGIAVNPGKLGKWLEYRGKAQLSLSYDNQKYDLTSYDRIINNRQFPISTINYNEHKKIPVDITVKSWAPIKKNDLFTTALPVIQTEINLINQSNVEQNIDLIFRLDSVFAKELSPIDNGVHSPYISLQGDVKSNFINDEVIYRVILSANESKKVHIVISAYDSLWVTAKKYDSVLEISKYTFDQWNELFKSTTEFESSLPLVDDKELNDILRWYIIPAMILTKCTSNDQIVTMGYRELNQRDSYWTSWLHLVLFPTAERIMLKESLNAIKFNGKVPTTILPKIERHDDLDINAFFILRFFRYINFYDDTIFAKEHWSAVKSTVDWLISRDSDKDGLPEQISFWGDWKDVKGIEGRKNSPFSALLYLASLKNCYEYAEKVNDQEAFLKYKEMYEKGYQLANKSFKKGGLWKDSYYQQVWYDGRDDGKILQDQMIGVFFGVVPTDRAEKIIEVLNKKNRTPYGIAETYPYYDSSFGYEPAEYHNGAVWPWLSFMDIWSRLKLGRREEAIQLIKEIAKADLYNSGDYLPNEHINSLTGKNLGFYIQGWNAALFGVYYFELKE